MSNPAYGAVRSLRAALLGAICVGLAVSGHVLAGGRAPSLWVLVLLSIPMGALSLVLTGRRRRLPGIGVTVAGSQLLLHQALMWSSSGLGCAVAGDPHAHLGHVAAGPVLDCSAIPAMPAMSGGASSGHFGAGAMLLAHVVAGLITTALLAYGESLLWRVWHRMVRLPRAAASAGPAHVASTLTPGATRSGAGPRMLAGATGRRGPPLLAPVAG